jgi:spermidine synthase
VTTRRRGPPGIVQPVQFGTAELVPDRDRPGAWLLFVDGVPQSYVDMGDPTNLGFEYMRRLASVVDEVAAPGQPVQVLHLGAGGATLPRYLAATRPGSRQRVVDHDPALIALVRRALPLPRGADLRIRASDARVAVQASPAGRYHLVIADVYRAGQMPRSIASLEYARQVARTLRPDGLYAVNVADLPPLAFSRVQAATLRAAFPDVCVMAEPGLLRGRRYGNVVLAAARQPGRLPVARLAAAAARDAFPWRVLHAADLDRFVGGARPFTDATATDSPQPAPTLFD